MSAKTRATSLAVTMIVWALPAHAQVETFVQAVAQLARASAQSQEAQANAIRAAADRMADALTEWDRRIARLERDADRHIERGVAYRVRGRLEDAVREFDAAIAARPNTSDVQLLRALTLESMRRPDDATRAFAAAWAADRNNPVKAYYVATRAAVSTADRERARAQLTDAYRQPSFAATRPAVPPFPSLDAIPDNAMGAPVVADRNTAQAFALLAAGHFSEAVGALRQPLRTTPSDGSNDPLVHFQRAQQDERIGQVASARHRYQQAVMGALFGRGTIYVAIARLAQVEGDSPAAIDALSHAVTLNPNDPYFHKELALANASEGRVDEAFCEMMAALLIDPADAATHAAIGQLFLDAERDEDAVRAFTRALGLRPDAFEVRYGLATALTRLGNTTEAARQLEQFERARNGAQEQRRRDIASDVDASTQRPAATVQDAVR
jgi:tetratricopeptide (TPR) repeat protein